MRGIHLFPLLLLNSFSLPSSTLVPHYPLVQRVRPNRYQSAVIINNKCCINQILTFNHLQPPPDVAKTTKSVPFLWIIFFLFEYIYLWFSHIGMLSHVVADFFSLFKSIQFTPFWFIYPNINFYSMFLIVFINMRLA